MQLVTWKIYFAVRNLLEREEGRIQCIQGAATQSTLDWGTSTCTSAYDLKSAASSLISTVVRLPPRIAYKYQPSQAKGVQR